MLVVKDIESEELCIIENRNDNGNYIFEKTSIDEWMKKSNKIKKYDILCHIPINKILILLIKFTVHI
jgi:hypothetical protein